jgi:hypothetical protein
MIGTQNRICVIVPKFSMELRVWTQGYISVIKQSDPSCNFAGGQSSDPILENAGLEPLPWHMPSKLGLDHLMDSSRINVDKFVSACTSLFLGSGAAGHSGNPLPGNSSNCDADTNIGISSSIKEFMKRPCPVFVLSISLRPEIAALT